MDGFKTDDPRYGRFLRVGEPPGPTETEADRRLRKLGEWLHAQDPYVLGVRLASEDREAGGRPMIHIAFPLDHNRTRRAGAPFDPRNPTIADLLGPEIAAGKRLNIHAGGTFDHACSYIRIPPEALDDKVEGDRRRLADALQKLDREIQPLVAAVVSAARGDVDHPTIAAPADWRRGGWRDQSTRAESDTPGSRELNAAGVDPARLTREYLAERGVKPEVVAAVKISAFVRQGEDWLRLDLPRGGNTRGIVPMLMDRAGIAVMKNSKAATDDEILGALYCRAADVVAVLGAGPSSMKEFRPRNGRRG